jgi:broad specificity phosphatase PhoE
VRLVVVRHGETDSNATHRFTGQIDVPLNSLGERQARAAGLALAGEHFDLVVVSDLLRARQTADAILPHLNASATYDPDLREISLGSWEGLTSDEIEERYPDELARHLSRATGFAPPGGESAIELAARVARALQCSHTAHPDGAVLWVTHGGVIGALICQVLGIDLAHRGQFRRDNAGATELVFNGSGGVLVRLNDTHYLAGPGSGERDQVL